MYTVAYDRLANILHLRVAGFWKSQDVQAFAKEVSSKALAAQAIRDDFNVCVESFEFPVQAIDVADLLTHIMRGGMGMTSGRAAVVVAGQLNRAQAERTLVHPRVRVFLDMDEAQEWLATPMTLSA